jgi:predicted hydrocarbon binding protein
MKPSYLSESTASSAVDTISAAHTMSPLIQVAPATLLALRASLLTRADLDTVFVLRDAGYLGGEQLYNAFESYIQGREQVDPQELGVEEFFEHAGHFFTQCGWGTTTLSSQDNTFCVVDIENCWEATPDNQPNPKGCHLTLGLLGGFLGKFADYPVSILEIEGPETGTTNCRFIAGNTAMVADYYARHS